MKLYVITDQELTALTECAELLHGYVRSHDPGSGEHAHYLEAAGDIGAIVQTVRERPELLTELAAERSKAERELATEPLPRLAIVAIDRCIERVKAGT